MNDDKHKQTKAIGLTGTGAFAPANVGEAIEVAKMIASSGMVPKGYENNAGGVLIALQMGAELGLQPMQSLQNIAVINGRPCLWGDAMLALVTSHPHCDDVSEWMDGDTAYCRVVRRGRSPVERSFSVEDAKTAGLWSKQGPWKQYPKRMLQLRARGFALRDSFPDTLRGIQLAEDAQDIVDQQPEFVPVPEQTPFSAGTHSVRKPKPEPKPEPAGPLAQPELIPEPPKSADAPGPFSVAKLKPGEQELIGMVDHAETMAELDLLIEESKKRRITKAARAVFEGVLASKRGEIQEAGKAEPGADG